MVKKIKKKAKYLRYMFLALFNGMWGFFSTSRQHFNFLKFVNEREGTPKKI